MKDKQVLKEELCDLQQQIETLEAELEEKPDGGLGRGAPAIARHELDRAIVERLKQRAANIRQALSRLECGAYGICAQCGKPIHPDRLAVLPSTQLCIRCAQAGQKEQTTSKMQATERRLQ